MLSPETFKRIRLDERIDSWPADEVGTMVYAAWTTRSKDRVKLGRTFRGPDVREHELALGNNELRLWCAMPGSPRLEYLLKQRFRAICLDGREIFQAGGGFIHYITRLVKLRGGVFY